MAAITRVEGPMLLANLDRQGTDLQFTTTGESLFYLNFTNFQVGVNTSVTSETLTVNGNALITTVKIDKFSTISTTQINQDLRLVANGSGNVLILGANVISGNIDNVQIGTLIPNRAVFTTANVITKAELKLANVQNLSGNRIVYTAADNTQLEDDEGLQWFASNNTLIAQNFATTQSSLFPSLTSDNITIPTIANNSVVYMAANNQLIGTPTIAYFAGNNLFRVTGNIEMGGQTQNRIIYKDTTDKLVTSDRLTYDGTNLSSPYPNINRFGNIRIFEEAIEQLQGGASQGPLSILPYNDPSAGRRVFMGGGTKITGVATAVSGVDSNDTVATVGYVAGAITGAVFNSVQIAQGDSAVVVFDPILGTPVPNVYILVDGVKNSEFSNGWANIQNLRIHDGVISTDAGDITLAPIDGARVSFTNSTSMAIPSGTTAQRPPAPIAGDFRHNSDHNVLEYHDGVTWSSVAPTIYTQQITGTGSTTAFTLHRAAADETVLITINGVVQRPSEAYTVDGVNLNFYEPPGVGDLIDVRYLTYAITYASTPLFVNTPFTTFSTSFVEIDSWRMSQYAGAQYEFVFKNPLNNQYAMGTVYLMHNSIDPFINVKEYSNGATPYLIFDSYIDIAGVVRLRVQGQNPGNFIKFRVTYFSDDQIAYISWVSQGNVGVFNNTTRSNIYVQLNATLTGPGTITYALSSGSLPPTAVLYANGVITGNINLPIASNVTYNFTAIASSTGASTQQSNGLSITLLNT